MTNDSCSITVQDIRRELLYFSSDKNNEDDNFVNAYNYKGRKAHDALSESHYEMGSGSGDFNSKQIIFLMIKYFLTIFLFSLYEKQKNPEAIKKYSTELQDAHAIFQKLSISFEGSENDMWVAREFLVANLTDFYGKQGKQFFGEKITPEHFYDLKLKSKPLIYLLFYFTGYGGNEFLIKDFREIVQQSEEMSYQKQQFIFQKSVALYREDFLLTMMLEPLSRKITPMALVDIYNDHLNYYNQLLIKDKQKGLPAKITGYSDKNSTNFRKDLAPPARLFPEAFYQAHPFPDFINSLTEEDKVKIIEIIGDLYNLPFDEESLTTSIKKETDSRLLRHLESVYNEANPKQNNRMWQYYIQDPSDFKALQMFWSNHKNLHLVFNKRIIDILNSFNIDHPFIYIDSY